MFRSNVGAVALLVFDEDRTASVGSLISDLQGLVLAKIEAVVGAAHLNGKFVTLQDAGIRLVAHGDGHFVLVVGNVLDAVNMDLRLTRPGGSLVLSVVFPVPVCQGGGSQEGQGQSGCAGQGGNFLKTFVHGMFPSQQKI